MEVISRWQCDVHGTDFNNNCHAAGEGIVGYTSKQDCEIECAGGMGLLQLNDYIAKSGVIYPFHSELYYITEILKRAAEQNVDPSSIGTEFADFVRTHREGGAFYVGRVINRDAALQKYLVDMGIHVMPKVFIYLHKVEKKDLPVLRSYAAEVNRAIADKKIPLNDMRAVVNLGNLHEITKSVNNGERVYIRVTDERLAHLLTGQPLDTNLISYGDHRVHNYISNQFEIPIRSDGTAASIVVIPISIEFLGYGSHANSITISPAADGTGEAFYFEPHVSAEWSRDMNEIIGSMFKRLFEKHNVKYKTAISESCPLGMQANMPYDYGSCQTWNMLIAITLTMNPTIPKADVMKSMLNLGQSIGLVMDLFIYHIYSRYAFGTIDTIPELASRAAVAEPAMKEITDYRDQLAATATDRAALLTAVEPLCTWAWMGITEASAGSILDLAKKFVQTLASGTLPDIYKMSVEYPVGRYFDSSKIFRALRDLKPM